MKAPDKMNPINKPTSLISGGNSDEASSSSKI